jgi:histidyl-tRNA synthetase
MRASLLFRRDDVLPPSRIQPWKLAMADPKSDNKADPKSNRPKARLPRGLADRSQGQPKSYGWLVGAWNYLRNTKFFVYLLGEKLPVAPRAESTAKAEPAAKAAPAAKANSSDKLKARLPRGLADRGPAEIAATRTMIESILKVYELYGFEAVETPAFEYTDALGKFLPDQDRPNEGVFSFKDDDEQWVSLRYDLTAPLARYVAENFNTLPKPYRSYRVGWVFRNEKPGPGRFRQFMQFDADTVGSASMAADAEICMMAADTMEALGLRGHYVVKVNNRKILDGVLIAVGLGGEENAGRRLTVLRSIDKLDRLEPKDVMLLLGHGRKDESGDFTEGARLSDVQAKFVLAAVGFGPQGRIASTAELPDLDKLDAAFVELNIRFSETVSGREGAHELRQIKKLIDEAGYQGRIVIDRSVVRGLEYYTGPVYEVELTFPASGVDGKPVRFGSVGGGGRYDGLIARFRGEAVPATGFSIGVSRLLAALTHLGKVETKPEPGPVIVTVLDKDRIPDYQRMASSLRRAGIRAELYLGSGKFGPQMKYADRRRSPCVVIQGSDEKGRGEVQIKDLIVGAELATLSKERDDYLQKQAAAQFAVPEADLVAKVREVLARHGVKWG